MQPPIYHVGQSVALVPSQLFGAGRGPYTILRLLPNEGRDREYRVQHHVDGHERIVQQSEISGEAAPALMLPSPPPKPGKTASRAPSRQSRALPRS